MTNLYAPDPNIKATMIKTLEQNKFSFRFKNKEQGADVIVFRRASWRVDHRHGEETLFQDVQE